MTALDIIGQVALPSLALIVSGISFYLTNRMNKKVNKKDYEISENLKYEILKLIAALRSLDAKAVLSVHINQKIDYSPEIKIISDLRVSPGYLIFLHSINDDSDRFLIDFNITFFSLMGNNMNMQDIRLFSNRILDILKNKTNLKGTLNVEVFKLIADLCEMKGTSPEYNADAYKDKEREIYEAFIISLVEKGCKDPDVLLFYSIIIDNKEASKEAMDYATKNGANFKVTDKEIIEKYQKEFELFKNEFKQN